MARTAFAPHPWLRRYRERPDARLQLVCHAHAGGSASAFAGWSDMCPPSIEVLAVQYPGRQDRYREPLMTDIITMASAIADGICAATRGRVALFGHSLGAAVAYEVARVLEGRGVRIHALFVSGRPAPSRERGGRTYAADDHQLLTEVVRLGGLDPAILPQPELLSLILPVIRGDYRLSETYAPTHNSKIQAPIIAVLGEEDPEVTAEEAHSWSAHTSSTFELHVLPGDHFYFPSQLPALVSIIASALARSTAA